MSGKPALLSPEALEFAPGLLSIQESPPSRLPRAVMYAVSALFALFLLWAVFGKLDIVASASGRLIPQNYVKIVQPSEAGIVRQILVKEGDHVKAGQVLMRMDATDADADLTTYTTDLALKDLELKRIDAELSGRPFVAPPGLPPELVEKVQAQYLDHREAYESSLGEAQQALLKAQRDDASGQQVLAKLRSVVPILKRQAQAYTQMGQGGYVARVTVEDKEREYLDKAGDLKAQAQTVASLAAAVAQAREQVRQITAKYDSDLQNERVDALGQYRKLQGEVAKERHTVGLLELRAPQAGIVKDLATHTAGTVVSPGTVLLSLVPENEPLVAEVMVKNDDVGFVTAGQTARIKLAAYPFEKYGMIDGRVLGIEPDASEEKPPAPSNGKPADKGNSPLAYKALVALGSQVLDARGKAYRLVPGMQVVAEIHLGRRTVMDYLLSPVEKTLDDSGHER